MLKKFFWYRTFEWPHTRPLGWTNFFPPPPKDLDHRKVLVVGTKSRSLGDGLCLTTLPRKLKSLYPGLKIQTFCRGLNPAIFENNPYVDSVTAFPGELYGDDCNWGSGHQIELKEQYFALLHCDHAKPELYLSEKEARVATEWRSKMERPLCIIHPWGNTCNSVLESDVWTRLIKHLLPHWEVYQVGVVGQNLIPGAKPLFLPPNRRVVRKLFAWMAQAQLFIGVDSGPMHVARAFNVPSVILLDQLDASKIFEERKRLPYYSKKVRLNAFLYEDNAHESTSSQTTDSLLQKIYDHMERLRRPD